MSDGKIKKDLIVAKEAYQSKNYEKAELIYDKYYENDSSVFNIWDKRFYAWTLYQLYIKNPINSENLIIKGELITDLVTQEDLSKKAKPCAYTLSVIKIMENFKEKHEYDELIYWSEKLNPDFLSEIGFKYKNNKGKPAIASSHKEKYYSLVSKAYLELGDYEKAIEISNEALSKINKIENNNDIWFKWKIAKAKKELEEYDEALMILNEIYKSKKDWFIQKEIADNYYFKNDIDNALKYSVDAALSFGDDDKKINLYGLLEDIFNEKNMKTEAIKHIEYIYLIKEHNQWNIDDNIIQKLENADIDLETINFKEVQRDLKNLWEEIKFSDQERVNGTISTIFPHGKAGFIHCDDGNSYYFSVNQYKGDKNELNIGLYVSFFLEDSFDKKKNEKTKEAVMIIPNNI